MSNRVTVICPADLGFDGNQPVQRMLIFYGKSIAMKISFFTCLFLCTSVAMAEDAAITSSAIIAPSVFTAAGHTTDQLSTVQQRLKEKKAVLLDVREKDEWLAGHLQHANFVPMSAVKGNMLTKEMKKSLPKDKPIYIHCAAGGRVLTVSQILRAKGYDIRPLKHGYDSLLKAGFDKAMPVKD